MGAFFVSAYHIKRAIMARFYCLFSTSYHENKPIKKRHCDAFYSFPIHTHYPQ